jgi:hypothetical protein
MAEDPITWSALKTSVRDWCDSDTGGISDDRLEECIALAERHFNRTIFTPDREAAFSVSADAQSEALPADFWGFKSGPYVDGTADIVLERLTPGALRAMYPTTGTGTPRHFAIEGENILFGPIPASATAIKGTYYTVISPLSGSTATNWLLTDHPDVYMAGTLYYVFLFRQDRDNAANWLALMGAHIETISRSGRQRSANSGPLAASSQTASVRNIQA